MADCGGRCCNGKNEVTERLYGSEDDSTNSGVIILDRSSDDDGYDDRKNK